MRKKQLNVGSAVIEMTLLIPILLGIVYLYLSLFLFLINVSKNRNDMVELLYEIDYREQEGDDISDSTRKIRGTKQGNKISVFEKVGFSPFEVNLELHRNEDSAVENIRRWQFVADAVRTGKEK